MRRLLAGALLAGVMGCSSKRGAPAPDPLADITIAIRPSSGVGWTVHVENRRPQPISILWDESAFVDTAGKSLGKLIPGSTRKMDIGRTLASEPVPAGAHVDEDVLLADMLDWAEGGKGAHGSGRASIEIDTGSGKSAWSGGASFMIQAATRWCIGDTPQCFNSADMCQHYATLDGGSGRAGCHDVDGGSGEEK